MGPVKMRRPFAAAMACAGLAILCPLFAPMAVAQTYLGEACWNVTITERKAGPIPPETFTMRTALTYVGGAHLLFQGTFVESGGTGVLNGAGEFVGADLVISMVFSRDQQPAAPLRDKGTLELRVNPQTWTGTWWALSTYFNTTTRGVAQDYAAGTATIAACP